MPETIYTIPVNEAFDAACGCPICALHTKLEENELDLILGASMMEPDIRQQTNRRGFCRRHYDSMLVRKNRLGLALMLESHLDELHDDMQGSALTRLLRRDVSAKRVNELEGSCYVCTRINDALGKMMDNAVYLWEIDPDFRAKLKKQPQFCLPHYAELLERGKRTLSKQLYLTFAADLRAVVETYFDSLREDVKHFIRKFDYRYEDEPWGNARDSVERAVRFLTSD